MPVSIANTPYLMQLAVRMSKNDNVRTPLLFSDVVFEGALRSKPPPDFGFRTPATYALLLIVRKWGARVLILKRLVYPVTGVIPGLPGDSKMETGWLETPPPTIPPCPADVSG